MTLIDRLGAGLPRAPVTVELDDIQATVLRYRPEPYYGTHVMLHVADAQAGREFVRRLAPHVDSAADWWQAGQSWISVAISYAGLVALGVPEDSLQSFPEAFRAGMAARASQLLDYGENDPEHWDAPFGSGLVHIGVSVFSDSEDSVAPDHGDGAAALRGISRPDRAADAGLRRPAGRPQPAGLQGLDRPARHRGQRRRSPARPGTTGQGRRVHPRLSRRGRRAAPDAAPDVLGRNGTFAGLRKYQSRVGTFNRFLREHAQTEQERELLAAKLVGRWRSGAPLTLAPDRDDPELGADPRRNNDFTYAADPDGRHVPLGSHMRRMNPRDTKLAILTDVNIHRIIRRSTTYGAPYDPDATSPQDDETPRGLYFIFLSAKAMATLEFLQQEWINNGNFMNLGEERDPNVGLQEDGATFTIPQEPVRRRIHGIETFNVLRGGEYFFLPSLSALRWLADDHEEESS